jgi:RNA polymerase sigma-70 factor (ECF subfamily)
MDVVQDTFIRVYEYKYLYKTKYEFSTWIYTIARNFALNELRRKKHSNYQEDIEDPIRHEDHLHTQETVSLILDYLSPKYREVIVLRYLQGMSFEEISKITGKNINTLKSLAKRGLDGGREMCERNGVEL